MTWTDTQWDTFVGLLDEAWPGTFDDTAAGSWRTLLDTIEPGAAVEGMRRLLLEGHRFRPSVSELLEAARRDPSKPTFSEAYLLIFGSRGALRARPARRSYRDDRERRDIEHQAIKDRADSMHPLVRTFIARQGIERLRHLPLSDPEWGEKHRRDLESAWNQHLEAMDGRDVAALASGDRREQLGRFDPLAALGRPTAPELDSGSRA